jgi:hypothetical protein
MEVVYDVNEDIEKVENVIWDYGITPNDIYMVNRYPWETIAHIAEQDAQRFEEALDEYGIGWRYNN